MLGWTKNAGHTGRYDFFLVYSWLEKSSCFEGMGRDEKVFASTNHLDVIHVKYRSERMGLDLILGFSQLYMVTILRRRQEERNATWFKML